MRIKYCRDCEDAKTVCTGSQIFYLCPYDGKYRSPADECRFQKEFIVSLAMSEAKKVKQETVSFAEYNLLQKLSSQFKCPLKRNPMECDERSCPSKPEFPFDEYLWECREHRKYRIKLIKILKGRIQVEG